jgi:hypothetical protein
MPWIIKNGYTKFFILDPDVHFTFKHVGIETLQQYVDAFLTEGDAPKITRDVNYVVGSSYYSENTSIYQNYYAAIVTELELPNRSPEMFYTNDGPVRFYNLDSTQMVMEFFELWNTGVRLLVTTKKLNEIGHGAVFLNDEFLLGAVYAILQLQIAPISSAAVNILHRVENRHFMPSDGSYKLASSLKEFVEINRNELINRYGEIAE